MTRTPARPLILLFAAFLSSAALAGAQTDARPLDGFEAFDTPNDAGDSILLTWKALTKEIPDADDKKKTDNEYVVYVSPTKDGEYKEYLRFKANLRFKSEAPHLFGFSGENKKYHFVQVYPLKAFPARGVKDDAEKKQREWEVKSSEYFYKIAFVEDGVTTFSDVQSTKAYGNLFNTSKLNNFILMVIFSVIILWFIGRARKGEALYLRKIAGLDAVEEAVGRATEMGKTVLFVHGLTGMGDVATIAAVNILGKIARKIAAYDATLRVANLDPIVLAVSQETVKNAYVDAGRADAYREDNVFFVASQQFSYVAAVSGIMMRERPAANVYMGTFMAESLLLTEGGAETGAIQIAGTDSYTQLPFFVTTCDYTLMGEELYAASAYLAREPKLLGSLKGQDAGKAFLVIVMVVGTILVSCGWTILPQLLKAF